MSPRIPNPWLVAVFAAALGTGLGAGFAWLRSATQPWQIGDFRPHADAGPDAPRAETSETEHAFGTIGIGAAGSHEFLIRNVGATPLVLTKGATSCTCTISDFDRAAGETADGTKTVLPGAEATVRVEWKGKGEGGPFRQQATIFTNDPRRPEIVFSVVGRLVPTWKAVPASVVFSRLAVSAEDRAEVRVYTYDPLPPSRAEATLDDSGTAQFFSLATAPLSAADLAAEPGATGGVLLTVTVRPGLPLGPLRRTIRIDFAGPHPMTADVPLEGVVTGDLALAGAAWDSSHQVLSLGTVSGRTGLRTQLFLTAKGPHRHAVRPVVREVVPEGLQVEVGDSQPVGSGGAVRTRLAIVIPPGSPPANHLCSEQAAPGRIVLDTGHPETPVLTIHVCVAIGP